MGLVKLIFSFMERRPKNKRSKTKKDSQVQPVIPNEWKRRWNQAPQRTVKRNLLTLLLRLNSSCWDWSSKSCLKSIGGGSCWAAASFSLLASACLSSGLWIISYADDGALSPSSTYKGSSVLATDAAYSVPSSYPALLSSFSLLFLLTSSASIDLFSILHFIQTCSPQ